MAIPDIDTGTSPNDGTGTNLRAGGGIINQILDMWNTVTGGIAYLLGNVGINRALPTYTLDVDGNIYLGGDDGGILFTNGTDIGTLIGTYHDLSLKNKLAFRATATEQLVLNIDGSITMLPVYSNTTASAANVLIEVDGTLKRSTSSREIKKGIKYNVDHESILKLKPATFIEKATGKKFIGFVAEDVNEIDNRFATNQDKKGLMGLDTTAILSAAVSKIQDLEKRLLALENK